MYCDLWPQNIQVRKLFKGGNYYWLCRYSKKLERLRKLHIFLEGHKILQNLHLTFKRRQHRTKVSWRFCKILWTSQNIWTLPGRWHQLYFEEITRYQNQFHFKKRLCQHWIVSNCLFCPSWLMIFFPTNEKYTFLYNKQGKIPSHGRMTASSTCFRFWNRSVFCFEWNKE